VSDSTLEGIGMEKEEGKNTSKTSRKKKRSQHKQEENDTIPKQCFILDQKEAELFQYCMTIKSA
jgi:hypothetical protein